MLKRRPEFSGFTPDEFNQLEQQMRIKEYPKGQLLLTRQIRVRDFILSFRAYYDQNESMKPEISHSIHSLQRIKASRIGDYFMTMNMLMPLIR